MCQDKLDKQPKQLLKKTWGLNGIENPDLCDTGAGGGHVVNS